MAGRQNALFFPPLAPLFSHCPAISLSGRPLDARRFRCCSFPHIARHCPGIYNPQRSLALHPVSSLSRSQGSREVEKVGGRGMKKKPFCLLGRPSSHPIAMPQGREVLPPMPPLRWYSLPASSNVPTLAILVEPG